MNIRDIEETLRTLKKRHPGLNEVMLATLLDAGGWEDKDIETAKVLFHPPVSKASVPPPPKVVPSEQPAPLPPVPDAPPVSSPMEPAPNLPQKEASPAPLKEEKKEPAPLKNLPVTEEISLLMPVIDEAHLVEAPHEKKSGDEPVPPKKEEKEPVVVKKFPRPEETPLFVPVPDQSHMVEAPHESTKEEPAPVLVVAQEPVSLLSKKEPSPPRNKEDLPHNLPLRPFETSEHVWPFSRYKDIFYGEDTAPSLVEAPIVPQPEPSPVRPVTPLVAVPPREVFPPQKSESVLQADVSQFMTPPPPVPAPVQEPIHMPVFRAPPQVERKVVIVEKTGDEKLVIMASVMLLAILLLLGYMYSNGRL